MKKIIDIWKKGWEVISRFIIFCIFLIFLLFPVNLIVEFLPKSPTGSLFDRQGFHPNGLYPIVCFIIFAPFAFYFASKWTGDSLAALKREKKN